MIDSDSGPEGTSHQLCGRMDMLAEQTKYGPNSKGETGTRLWPDRATARAAIFDFAETFYNRRRLRKHTLAA